MDKNSSIISFVFGDIFAMGYVVLGGVFTGIGHFGLQILSTLVIGAAGGLAGMVGKELIYPRLKRVFKKK